jgi:hypothetical protein
MKRSNEEFMKERAFIFIGGLHRSGTTLLHDCLAQHPEVSALSDTGVPMNEGHHLQHVYPPAKTKRKLWPIRYLRPIAPSFLTSRGYGGPGRFAFDPGSHLTEDSKLVNTRNAQSILNSWDPYWDANARLCIEKSPPNLLITRFLQALFPASFFVIIYRHPIPVSYATRRWAKVRPFHLLLKHWLVAYEQFENDRGHLRHVMTLKYEDFVVAPDFWLTRIFEFVGLSPVAVNQKISPAVNAEYFERWNRSLQTSRLMQLYARWIRDRFEGRFNQFGYTLGDPYLTGPDAGLLR